MLFADVLFLRPVLRQIEKLDAFGVSVGVEGDPGGGGEARIGVVGEAGTEIVSGLTEGQVVVIPKTVIASTRTGTNTNRFPGAGGGGGAGLGRLG